MRLGNYLRVVSVCSTLRPWCEGRTSYSFAGVLRMDSRSGHLRLGGVRCCVPRCVWCSQHKNERVWYKEVGTVSYGLKRKGISDDGSTENAGEREKVSGSIARLV